MRHLASLRGGLLLALAAALPAQDSRLPASYVRTVDRTPGFIENRGQWPDTVRFRNKSAGATAWIRDDGLTLRLAERMGANGRRGVVLHLTFDGAEPPRRTRGRDRLPGRHNFLVGRDESRWAVGVPAFGRTVTAEAYPGIDVVWQWREGRLAYDLHVAPGADPSRVVTRVDGGNALSVDADGNLVIATDEGEVRLTAPVSWERDGARRRPVDSRFVLDSATTYRIEVERANPDAALVIDPGLEWAASFGSPGEDHCMGVAADDQNLVYAVGFTDSVGYPTSAGVFQENAAIDQDAVLSCLDPSRQGNAQLLWSTYYGGDGPDLGYDVAVNPTGTRVTVVGTTRSANLPRRTSMQPAIGGGWDAFVAQFTNNGSTVRWTTYAGGIRNDRGLAIERISANAMLIGGTAGNEGFPVSANAFQRQSAGGDDAYIMILNPNAAPAAQLVASTLLGGRGSEAQAIALGREEWNRLDVAADPAGNGYLLCGTSKSNNLPATPGAFQTERGAATTLDDSFVALFNNNLSQLRYCSYLGGDRNDWIGGVGFNGNSEIIVTGTTFSSDLPVSSNPYQNALGGGRDGFVFRIDPAGNGAADILYGSYFGDGSNEMFLDCFVESSGIVVCCGENGGGIPTTPGGFTTNPRGRAAIVRIDPADNGASDLHYSARIGDGGDQARAIAPSADGAFFIAGATATQATFPVTPQGYTSSNTGGTDVFVARIDTLPANMTRLAVSTPACNGNIDLQVNGQIGVGAMPFELIANNVPPNSRMALILLGVPLNGAFLFLTPGMFELGAPLDSGVRVFLLPNAWQFSENLSAPGTEFMPSPYPLGAPLFQVGSGALRVPFPGIPMPPGGTAKLAFQCVFFGTAGCGGMNRLYASDRISF